MLNFIDPEKEGTTQEVPAATGMCPQELNDSPCVSNTGQASRRSSCQRAFYRNQKIDRQEFIGRLSNCCPHPTHLINGEANRSQLVQSFRDNYIPEPHCADFPPLIWIVNTASRGKSTALNGAVNAVSVHSIYRNTNDVRFLQAGTNLYCNAVKKARQELNSTMDPATSVAISYTFSFCELLRCEALDDSSAEAHTLYTMAILASSRDKPCEKVLKQMSDGNIRAFSTWGLLIQRNCPANLDLKLRGPDSRRDGEMSTLLDLALVVCKLAKKTNTLCSLKAVAYTDALLDHLANIQRLEALLYDWMGIYSAQFDVSTYWLVDSEHSSLPRIRSTKLLFNKVYEFPDFRFALLHITFWMSLIALFQSYIRILEMHSSKLGYDHIQDYTIRKKANEHADDLCRAIPYMGKYGHGFASRIMAIHPLHFLSLYFKERKNWAKLAWCKHFAIDIGSIKKPTA